MNGATTRAIAVIAVVGAGAAGCGEGSTDESIADAAILAAVNEAVVETMPEPVSASPDGALLLRNGFSLNGEERLVEDRATGSVVASQLSRSNSRFIQPVWSPTSDRVALYTQGEGDESSGYTLLIWEIDADSLVATGVPGTSVTTTPRWTRTGTRITHVVEGSRGEGSRDLYVVDVARPASPILMATGITEKGGITWSPDGKRLATVLESHPKSIAMLEEQGQPSLIPVATGCSICELAELAWSPAGDAIFVAMRGEGEEWFSLHRVDLATGNMERLPTPAGDARVPRPLSRPEGVLYNMLSNGVARVGWCPRGGEACEPLGPLRGATTYAGHLATRDSVFLVYRTAVDPPRLFAVSRTDQGMELLAEGSISTTRLEGTSARWLSMSAPDGVTIHAFHWEAKRAPGDPRKVLISVPGGPALKTPVGWDPRRQFILDSGIDIVLVAYRGQLGFGASLEHAPGGEAARVRDVLTVREHILHDLSLPPEDVLLFGSSYGAMLVANAAVEEPTVGTVVLLGTLPSALSASNFGRRRGLCAAAFHGEVDDRVSPERAYRDLGLLLGGEALEPPCGHFRVFKGESHVPSRHASMNEIVATIVTLLGRGDDPRDVGSSEPRTTRDSQAGPSQ